MCRLKFVEGLGFTPLTQMNQALLGKWLWRIGENPKGLCIFGKVVRLLTMLLRPIYRFKAGTGEEKI